MTIRRFNKTDDEPTRPTYEIWSKRFESPGYRMNMHWFAKDGDRLVGCTGLWLSEADPEKIHTGPTGVVRSHMRKTMGAAAGGAPAAEETS